MSEARIAALEVGHAQLRKDLSDVAVSQRELYKQQASLDKTMNSLLIKLESLFEEDKDKDKTLHDIKKTVDHISIKIASGPMERHKEVQSIVDPLFDNLRQQDKKFTDCGERIKLDLRKEARSHLFVVWFAVLSIGSMGIYVLKDARDDILASHSSNSALIKSFHNRGVSEHAKIQQKINR